MLLRIVPTVGPQLTWIPPNWDPDLRITGNLFPTQILMLNDALAALRESLTLITGVSEWDYWGLAPDSEYPEVGQIWPTKVSFSGARQEIEFFCAFAIYTPGSPSGLLSRVSQVVSSIQTGYGPTAYPCALGSSGFTASLGSMDIGSPSTTAPSSVGPQVTGSWVAVSFNLSLSK
jgi:hypothetical protein